MKYKHLNIKFHFGDRVIYKDDSYIVVSYNGEDGMYEIYKDYEWCREGSMKKEDPSWKMGKREKASERVLKRDYQGEMKEELEVMDMSRDIVKAHKELLDKINTNKNWYKKIFN